MRDTHALETTQSATPDALAGSYVAPSWLPGGHAQTIWPHFLRCRAIALRREAVETGDGDLWWFDWLATPAREDAPLVVLFHGLEGGSSSHYARALFAALSSCGWRGVVPHFRGCPGIPNRRPRAYHSGDHEEIASMFAAIRERVDDATRLYACGVSLGGSAFVNWLGRAGTAALDVVARAAAVSAPLDLPVAGQAIDRGFNRIYARHFLDTLKPKARAMVDRFPGMFDAVRLEGVRSMWEFDDLVTAPLHGFRGADDYWNRAAAKPWLRSIAVPTLVLNARNDPFIPGTSLPGASEVSAAVTLEQPRHGGHAGFPVGAPPGRLDWLPRRLLAFFSSSAPGPV